MTMNRNSERLLDEFAAGGLAIKVTLAKYASAATRGAALVATLATIAACSPEPSKSIDVTVVAPDQPAHEYVYSNEGLRAITGVPVTLVQDPASTQTDVAGHLDKILSSMGMRSTAKTEMAISLLPSMQAETSMSFHNEDKPEVGCVISVDAVKDVKRDIATRLIGQDTGDAFEHVPGTERQWRTILTLHEAQHCTQGAGVWSAFNNDEVNDLKNEIDADQKAIKGYRLLVRDDPHFDVPTSMIKMRNIGAMNEALLYARGFNTSLDRATASFLSSDGAAQVSHSASDATASHRSLAEHVYDRAKDQTQFGSTPHETAAALIGATREVLKDRAISLSPLEAKIAKDYIQAWEYFSPKLVASQLAQGNLAARTQRSALER